MTSSIFPRMAHTCEGKGRHPVLDPNTSNLTVQKLAGEVSVAWQRLPMFPKLGWPFCCFPTSA